MSANGSPTRPSTAASAQYGVACPTCDAGPNQACRTAKTNRVTDTHPARIDAAYPDHPQISGRHLV